MPFLQSVQLGRNKFMIKQFMLSEFDLNGNFRYFCEVQKVCFI